MFRYISRVFARQVIRRIAVIVVGALFMLLPALWGGLQAHAASPYDDFVISDTLQVSNGVNSFDISQNFTSIILDDDDVDSDIKTSLLNAINSEIGGWSVTQASEPSGNKYVIYKWNVDRSDINLQFRTSQPLYNYLNAWGQDGYCTIQYSQFGAVPICELAGGYTHEIVSTPINNNPDHYFGAFIINYDIQYPPEYEGELLPDTAPVPPVTGEQYAPDWRILTANNWKAEIRDYRFTTFDGIPWTCSEDGNSIVSGHEGLAPVIEWELYNENNTLIDDGILSATAHWNYQFEENNVDTTYTIKGRYDCGGDVNFGVIGEKEFTITETGLLKEQDFFADCVMLEPPFVDVQACIENVFRVIEILTFNQITLVQGLNSTENCRQLVVLGHWINKPYEVVCPQFSQTVRNTITPFVTFILGLLTAMVIVRVMNNRGIS